MNLECPVVSHEKPENLIAGARRKVFSLSKCKDLPLDCSSGEGWRQDSLLSLVNSEESLKKSARRVPSLSKIVSKKSVTFVDADPDVKEESADDCNSPHLPLVQSRLQLDEQPRLLMRARLVQQSAHDSILVLSFPRIVCDFWSSCLFVQQLTNTYARLEESSRHRPSLVGSRIRSFSRVETSFSRGPQPRVSVRGGRQHRRLSERVKTATGRWPKSMSFQQVALREAQLLKLVPKERLWTFWNSMITALIQRRHGATRVKVIPPIRLPSGLGEKTHTARPQTSRLRPLTARMRPQTARKTVGGMAAPRDTLAGPKSEFHFIKVYTSVGVCFSPVCAVGLE